MPKKTGSLILNPTKLAQDHPIWVGWLLGALAAASVEIGERIIVVIWGWYKWVYIFTESIRLLLRGLVGFLVFASVQYWLCHLLGGRGNYSRFTALLGYSWLPLSFAALVVWPIFGFVGLSPLLSIAAIGLGGIWSVVLGVGVMRTVMSLTIWKAVLAYSISLIFGYFLFQMVF